MVAAAAWVSTSGEEALARVEQDPAHARGLIKSLMENRHGTPFEHGAMSFFVHAPIFVWREWHRHRTMSYNEESGRYKKLEPVFWIPRYDRAMIRPERHRAMAPAYNTLADARGAAEGQWLGNQLIQHTLEVCQLAYDHYEWEINEGIANEVARRLLPVSIYSSCWVTCNPRSLMAFLSLRTHDTEAQFVSYPQAEIEEAARAAEQFLAKGWPITYEMFNRFGRVAP